MTDGVGQQAKQQAKRQAEEQTEEQAEPTGRPNRLRALADAATGSSERVW